MKSKIDSGDSRSGRAILEAPSEILEDDSLVSLGKLVYGQALVRRGDEQITDPRGRSIGWLLDTRIPMLSSTTFKRVGAVMATRLAAKGATQVVGYGFGAYAIVCSILGAPNGEHFVGGFLREERKTHGRKRIVEGPIDPSKPVVLVDDILNSGRSALTALELIKSENLAVEGVATLFNFTWSAGRSRLEARGLWVDSLLDLNLRENMTTSHL